MINLAIKMKYIERTIREINFDLTIQIKKNRTHDLLNRARFRLSQNIIKHHESWIEIYNRIKEKIPN